jgi:transposase
MLREVFMKERLPRAKFTKEFREEAVKLVEEGGLSIYAAAERLNMSHNTLGNWVKAKREGTLGDICKGHRPYSEAEVENARLRRELAQARMERDILKKAAAYFARESQPGTRR